MDNTQLCEVAAGGSGPMGPKMLPIASREPAGQPAPDPLSNPCKHKDNRRASVVETRPIHEMRHGPRAPRHTTSLGFPGKGAESVADGGPKMVLTQDSPARRPKTLEGIGGAGRALEAWESADDRAAVL